MPDTPWFSLLQQAADVNLATWPQWLPALCGVLLAPLLLWVAVRSSLRQRRLRREQKAQTQAMTEQRSLLESRIEQAERFGKLGFWSWNAADETLTLSPQVLRLHQLTPHPALPIDSFDALLSAYAPESRAALRAAWERACTQGHGWELTLPLLRLPEPESQAPDHEEAQRPRWARPLHETRATERDQEEETDTPVVQSPRLLRIIGEPVIENGVLKALRGSFQDVSQQRDRNQLQSLVQNTAEVARRTQSTFLAQLGQEIGRPLNDILGLSELLLDPQAEAQDRHQAARTIRRQGQHLARRISDRLDAARIQAGALEVEPVAVDTRRLLQETLERLTPQARERGLGLHLVASEPIPATIHSDPMRLRQALTHLIGNALQVSENGGVRVEAQFDGVENLLHLDVVDLGPGQNRRQTDQELRPLNVDAALVTSRRHPATEASLGLFIAHHIAQRLGGRLATQGQPTRAGSHIRLTLATGPVPTGTLVRLSDVELAAPSASATTPAPVQADAPSPAIASLATTESTEPPAPRTPRPPEKADTGPRALEGLRVLLVEDSQENQRVIQTLLQRFGAETAIAENGLDGMERTLDALHRGEAFDVVLMDMQMPIMDGYAAATRLREEGYTGPILGMSAQSIRGEEEKCLAAGCDASLSKPIDQAALLRALTGLIEPVTR